MKLAESIRIGWRAITGHKLRSTLTTLGVVIGVGAVIVFVVMGNAFMADALADVDDDPEPTLSVQTEAPVDTGFGWRTSLSPTYTEHDVEELSSIDGVESVAPDGWLSGTQLSSGEQQFTGNMNTRATVPEYFTGEDVEGELFSSANETVVNEETIQALDPALGIGEELTVRLESGREIELTVTGVVDDGSSGWNANPTVYLPLEPHYTLQVETPRETTERAYPLLEIRTENTDVRDDVKEAAREYLRTESDASELTREEHDIRVLTQEDQIERFQNVIDQITVFVAAVAGIALVVGSIGIANIMIVSVTERTRQIGIMKAVGARKRDIIQLFLVESLILGVIGAVVGVVAGLGVGYLAVSLAGWPMAYPVNWIVISVGIGIAVGAVSGVYPAWRGARIDPVDSLRHE